MCEPATIAAGTTWLAANAGTIAAVSSVAGAGLTIASQSATAKAQAAGIRQATVENYDGLQREGVEMAASQAVEQEQIARERRSRMATAKVSAAAAGISGMSVDAMLMDLSGKGLEAANASEVNYLRQQEGREDQGKALLSNARAQLSQVKTPGVYDYLGAGLKIADAGVKWSAKK